MLSRCFAIFFIRRKTPTVRRRKHGKRKLETFAAIRNGLGPVTDRQKLCQIKSTELEAFPVTNFGIPLAESRCMNTIYARRLQIRSSYQTRIQLVACALILIAYVIAMTGCGKNEETHSADGTYAVTPMSEQMQACANGVTYQGRSWEATPYNQFNVVPYGAQGCAPGTQQMCDGQYGLVCVPAQYLGNQNVAWWSQGQTGYGFAGYSAYVPMQYPSSPYPSGPRYRGGRHGGFHHNENAQFGMTCQVGMHQCGPVAHCRPFAPGQPVGICAQ